MTSISRTTKAGRTQGNHRRVSPRGATRNSVGRRPRTRELVDLLFRSCVARQDSVNVGIAGQRDARHAGPLLSSEFRGRARIERRPRRTRAVSPGYRGISSKDKDGGCPNRVIRYSFGRDRLSTNVRFASIPTVNSGLWDLSRCANQRHSHRSKTARYSITSSARASTDAGTVRLSALAVLRLMTSSYFVGACTGMSAGFSPLRIRST